MKFLFKKETFLESTAIVILFHGVLRAIDMIRGITFARILGPELYGTFTLSFLFVGIIAPLACLGLPGCCCRYVPLYEQKGMAISFIKRILSLTFMFAMLWSVVGIFLSPTISFLVYGKSQYYSMIIVASLAVVPLSLYDGGTAILNGLRLFKFSSLLELVCKIVFMLSGIFLLFFWKKSSLAPMLGYAIGLLCAVLIFFYLMKRELESWSEQRAIISENKFYKKILQFSFWLTITPIVFSLFYYADRWMLNRFLNLEAVGLYSVAANLARMVLLAGMIIGHTLEPTISGMWEKNEKQQVMHYLNFTAKVTVFLSLGGATLIVLLRVPLLRLLYGIDYLYASHLMPILLISVLIHSAWSVLMLYAKLCEKTYIYLVVCIIGFFGNIVLNYFLIRLYGMMGAAIASTLAFIMIFCASMILFKKYRFTVELKALFSIGTIFILILPSVLIVLSLIIIVVGILKSEVFFSVEEKNTIVTKTLSIQKGFRQAIHKTFS